LLAGILSAASLTGCSGSGGGFASRSAEAIGNDAFAAMGKVTSLTMAGTVAADDGPITLRLAIDRKQNCTGTMRVDGHGRAEILSVQGVVYFRGDTAFWKSLAGGSAARIGAQVGARWAKAPTGSELAHVCDLDALLDDLDDPHGKLRKGDVTKVDGQRTVEIVSAGDEQSTRIFVATDAPHRILRLQQTKKKRSSLSLSGFDEPVRVHAPAAADVVDLSSFR
jgi:hypothetical protein